MTITNPSARIQLREVGQLQSPGNCSVCGNATCKRGYVDLDLFFEYEGQVYLCVNCAEEAASTIDCLNAEESEFLVTQNKELATQNAKLKEQLDAARITLDLFNSALRGVVNDASDGSVISEPATSESPDQGTTDEPVVSGTEQSSKPAESTPKRRSTNPKRTTVRNDGFNL